MWDDFKKFIARGNVVDLAVGVIMGAAFGAIVNNLVDNVVMRPIGMLIHGIDFSNLYIYLNGQHYDSYNAAKTAGAPVIGYGVFLNAVVKFLITAFAVYLMVKGVNKLEARLKIHEESKPPPRNEQLLEEIRDLLKKEIEK